MKNLKAEIKQCIIRVHCLEGIISPEEHKKLTTLLGTLYNTVETMY